MSLEYRIGDVSDRLKEIPDSSIDLIVTSPPFLALRSYLPANHPDKHREIGSEATPADFLDTLLALTAEFGRVLAPHGSICIELGDKLAGSGGAGGDYDEDGLRAGQPKFGRRGGDGWPLDKSLCGIPTLYTWSLAYGRNLLRAPLSARQMLSGARHVVDMMREQDIRMTADEILAWIVGAIEAHEQIGPTPEYEPWRIRNVIVWARPNPPVGALGDKFRPATSYITVACRGAKRFFDLDAVRGEFARDYTGEVRGGKKASTIPAGGGYNHVPGSLDITMHPAGAPPLDWHTDNHPEDGDWLWKLPTQPYSGSHYATFPFALPKRLIEAMCPRRVCPECGPLDSSHDASMRDVREPDHESVIVEGSGSEASLLLPRLWDGGSDEGATRSGSSSGLSTEEQAVRIRRGAMAGTPDGEQIRSGVRAPTDYGGPSRSDVDPERSGASQERHSGRQPDRESPTTAKASTRPDHGQSEEANNETVSSLWGTTGDVRPCPSCGGPTRVGRVLDPFAGSGTTLEAAQAVGRHAIGIDLDSRNADLAQQRIGMFLTVEGSIVD